jgi:sec-independent protein translocase protein TatA
MNEFMQNVMAIQMPQGLDWVWILLIVLVIFGGKKLPDLAKNLGKGMSEFKKGLNEVQNEVQNQKTDIVNEIKKPPTNDDSKKTV